MKDPTKEVIKACMDALATLEYDGVSVPVYETVTAKTSKPYIFLESTNTVKGFSENKDSFSRQVFVDWQIVTEVISDTGNSTDCLQIANNAQELLKPTKKDVLDLGAEFKMITLIFSNTPHVKEITENGIQFRKTITLQSEVQQLN